MRAAEQRRPGPVRSAEELAVPAQPVEVVVAGASAGGVEALQVLVGSLPRDFGAALVVVLHLAESGTSVLAEILARTGALPVHAARDREPVRRGHVYVAPPNHHLLMSDGALHLSRGPRENGHRPAIDPLFRTAAATYGRRVAGVVLSGMLDDGTVGLLHIRQHGGITLVQDPATALYGGMPRSAVEHVEVSAILALAEIGPALARIAGRARADSGPALEHDRVQVAQAGATAHSSRFVCPDCGGVLFEHRDGEIARFRCSVGHSYSLESLLHGQGLQLEVALWAAVRSLEDRAVLLRRMERSSQAVGHLRASRAFQGRAQEAADRARLIRAVLDDGDGAPLADETSSAPQGDRR